MPGLQTAGGVAARFIARIRQPHVVDCAINCAATVGVRIYCCVVVVRMNARPTDSYTLLATCAFLLLKSGGGRCRPASRSAWKPLRAAVDLAAADLTRVQAISRAMRAGFMPRSRAHITRFRVPAHCGPVRRNRSATVCAVAAGQYCAAVPQPDRFIHYRRESGGHQRLTHWLGLFIQQNQRMAFKPLGNQQQLGGRRRHAAVR